MQKMKYEKNDNDVPRENVFSFVFDIDIPR